MSDQEYPDRGRDVPPLGIDVRVHRLYLGAPGQIEGTIVERIPGGFGVSWDNGTLSYEGIRNLEAV